MPAKYADEDELSGQMSSTSAAKANSMIFKRIQQFVKESNIILIIINHINQKVDINPMAKTKAQTSYLKQDETLPGGNCAIYLSNLLIRFDDNTKLKENEGMNIDGNYVDLTLVKSRTNAAGKSATLIFDKKVGFDPELSLLLMLKQENKINGAGAFLYLGDRNDMKFSQKAFKTKLNTIPEFRELFESECRKCLMEKLQAQVVLDNVYSENNTTAGIMAKGLFIEDEVCCVE